MVFFCKREGSDNLKVDEIIKKIIKAPTLDEMISKNELIMKSLLITGAVGNLITILLVLLPLSDISLLFFPASTLGICFSYASIYFGRWRFDLNSRQKFIKSHERFDNQDSIIHQMFLYASLNFVWAANLSVIFVIIPLFESAVVQAEIAVASNAFASFFSKGLSVITWSTVVSKISMLVPAIIAGIYIYNKSTLKLKNYIPDYEEFLKYYRYRDDSFYDVFNSKQNDYTADVIIGHEKVSGEKIRIPAKSRTLNTMIVGTIGSGKSSAIILKMIQQDLESFAKYIRAYADNVKNPNFWTSGEAAKYLNGFSLIDPSNDLCQKTLKLALNKGIPRELITYLNPSDPNTDRANLLNGPTGKAAEVFTEVVSGIAGKTGDFFAQAQRTHLKQHVYLLKLSALEDTKAGVPTFDNLMLMYSDIEEVVRRYQLLKRHINKLRKIYEYTETEIKNKGNVSKILKRKSKVLKVEIDIAARVQDYFSNLIIAEKGFYPRGHPHEGKQMHRDAEAEYVKGLRNILDDISSNANLRYVLFDESDFDLDIHFRYGGILIVNTDVATMGGSLSGTFGRFIFLSLQNAAFRRIPDIMPISPIYADEIPSYITQHFTLLTSQSRKYNVPIISAMQGFSQLSLAESEDFMTSVMVNMRNKIVFGDVFGNDAKLASDLFGEKYEYQETLNEAEIDQAADLETNRLSKMSRRVEALNITTTNMARLDAYSAVARIIDEDNNMDQFIEIDTELVDIENKEKYLDIENNEDDALAVKILLGDKHKALLQSVDQSGLQYMSEDELNQELEDLEPVVTEQIESVTNKNVYTVNSSPTRVINPRVASQVKKVDNKQNPEPTKPVSRFQGLKKNLADDLKEDLDTVTEVNDSTTQARQMSDRRQHQHAKKANTTLTTDDLQDKKDAESSPPVYEETNLNKKEEDGVIEILSSVKTDEINQQESDDSNKEDLQELLNKMKTIDINNYFENLDYKTENLEKLVKLDQDEIDNL